MQIPWWVVHHFFPDKYGKANLAFGITHPGSLSPLLRGHWSPSRCVGLTIYQESRLPVGGLVHCREQIPRLETFQSILEPPHQQIHQWAQRKWVEIGLILYAAVATVFWTNLHCVAGNIGPCCHGYRGLPGQQHTAAHCSTPRLVNGGDQDQNSVFWWTSTARRPDVNPVVRIPELILSIERYLKWQPNLRKAPGAWSLCTSGRSSSQRQKAVFLIDEGAQVLRFICCGHDHRSACGIKMSTKSEKPKRLLSIYH